MVDNVIPFAPRPADQVAETREAVWLPWSVEQLHRTSDGMVHIDATIPDSACRSMLLLLQHRMRVTDVNGALSIESTV